MLGVTHDGGTRVPIQQPVLRDRGGVAVFAGPLEKRGIGADAASMQPERPRDCRPRHNALLGCLYALSGVAWRDYTITERDTAWLRTS
jgi:hypothetical protein